MKKFLAIILVVLCAAGCSERKVIPDDELAQIVQDLALVNAYAQQKGIKADSIDLYSPVFDRYGYTMADFRYTLTTFSRRKSMKVSDIINQANTLLQKDFNMYSSRVAALDSVNARSRRMFSERVELDSTIRVRRMSDTSRLRLTIPVKEGRYDISYRYTLDSTDTNYGLRSSFVLVDTGKVRRTVNTQWLSPRSSRRLKMSVDVGKVSKQMILSLGGYNANSQTPNITIDSLNVVWLPVADDAVRKATDSLYKYKLKIGDATFPPKSSLTPPLYPTRADSTSSRRAR